MILRYTPRARQDLNEIKNYVKNELANPQAAARIVESSENRRENTEGVLKSEIKSILGVGFVLKDWAENRLEIFSPLKLHCYL